MYSGIASRLDAVVLKRARQVIGTQRHFEILKNTIVAESEHDIIHVTDKLDMIWLKQQRNSLQDQADIEMLLHEKA